MWPCEFLMNPCQSLPILTNFSRTLRFINNQFAEFLANPFRILRILTNVVANLANTFERLMNETTTQRVLANVFSLSLIPQHPTSELLVLKGCYPLSCPWAEERAVVSEAGARARESLTIPLMNTKALLPMVQHPVMTRA